MQPAEEAVLLARAIGLLAGAAGGGAADGGGSAGEEREG